MVDYTVQLNATKKLSRREISQISHPLRAHIGFAKSFGRPTIGFNADEQVILVNDFDGTAGDLNNFVQKIARGVGQHSSPNIVFDPEITVVEDQAEQRLHADRLEPTEEMEALQYTLDLILSINDEIEQQNHWYEREIEKFSDLSARELDLKKDLEELNSIKAERSELERRVADFTKENQGLKENYSRKTQQIKRLQIRNSELEGLEDRLDELIVEGADATKIRIGEVAKSTSKLRDYERKLKEMEVEDPEEINRIASMNLAQYATEITGRNYESNEEVFKDAKATKFEDSLEYSGLIKDFNEAQKAMKFIDSIENPDDLPDTVRSAYEQVEERMDEYERTTVEFNQAEELYSRSGERASKLKNIIQQHKGAIAKQDLLSNKPDLRLHIVSNGISDRLYFPISALGEINSYIPEENSVTTESDYSVVILHPGEGRKIATQIRDNVSQLPVKITLEQEF